MTFKYLDVCAGISAATIAFSPLGWKPLAFSEIEPFPRAVLHHHYPTVPLHGDFTHLRDEPWIYEADLLMGGTPCQAFSLAGLRQSLADGRGNLALEFIRLANAIDVLRAVRGLPPIWVLWENVDGVLSVKDNAFGAFLGGMVGADTALAPEARKWTRAGVVAGPQRVAAWRVLDAQYFGLAQRRKRVFVLSRSGPRAFGCAEALLPLIERAHGHPAPRREPPPADAGAVGSTAEGRVIAFGGNNTQGPIEIAPALLAHHGAGYKLDFESETLVAYTVPILDGAKGRTAKRGSRDGTGLGEPGDPMFTLRRESQHAVAFALRGREGGAMPEVHGDGHLVGTLRASGGGSSRDYVAIEEEGIRRLMPVECERLQGFPDDFTRLPQRIYPKRPGTKHFVKYADLYEERPDGSWLRYVEDGPRYRALGNSIATTVLADIGRRIEAVRQQEAA